MKLLLYVSPNHGAPDIGAVDYEIADLLATQIVALGYKHVASAFVIVEARPAPDVHRLPVQAATDESILDALGILANQIGQAKRWAGRVLSFRRPEIGKDPGTAPPYIRTLWERWPKALYRDLLGPEVARAMRLIDGAVS